MYSLIVMAVQMCTWKFYLKHYHGIPAFLLRSIGLTGFRLLYFEYSLKGRYFR
jgi:hypothetical protein